MNPKREGRTNGLFFSGRPELSIPPKRQLPVALAEYAVLLLFLFGLLITLRDTLRFSLSGSTVVGAFASALLFVGAGHLQKYRRKIYFAAAALGVAALMLFGPEMEIGRQLFQFRLFEAINKYYGTALYAEIPTSAHAVGYVRLFILAGEYLLSGVVGWVVVRSRNWLVLLGVSTPFFWMAVNLGKTAHLLPCLLLLLGILMLYAMRRGMGRPARWGFTPRGEQGRRRWPNRPELTREGTLKGGLCVAALAAAVTLLVTMAFPPADYVWNTAPKEWLLQKGREIGQSVQTPGSFLLPGGMVNGGVSNGRLGRVDSVSFLNRDMLLVSGLSEQVPLYLKGYVGSVYQGDHWEELPPGDYRENSWKSAQFDAEPFYGALQKSEAACRPVTMTIQNIAAETRYRYLPYAVANEVSRDSVLPGELKNDGWIPGGTRNAQTLTAYFCNSDAENNSLSQLYGPVHTWAALYSDIDGRVGGGWDAALRQRRDEYAAFAQASYTRLPEQGLERFSRDYSPMDYAGLELPEIVSKVKRDVQQGKAYSLSPGRTPGGADFVEDFLYEKKTGYCVHFAAAATLMFRAAGVPARYVEGYVLWDDDYARQNAAGEIAVRDSAAHAWPEIYVPHFGWTPVEVTPGFVGTGLTPPQLAAGEGEASESMSSESMSSESASSAPASSESVSSALVSSALVSSAPVSSAPASSAPVSSESVSSALVSTQPEASGNTSGRNPLRWDSSQPMTTGRKLALSILALIIFALLVLRFRRWLILRRREKQIFQRNGSAAIIAGYRLMVQMLDFCGFRAAAGESPEQFAARAEQQCRWLHPAEFQAATVSAQAARFSGRKPLPEELTEMRELLRKLDYRINAGLKLIPRLRYRYISCAGL